MTLRKALTLAFALVLFSPLAASAGPAPDPAPVDDYASYQPQTRCYEKVRKGTRRLAAWLEKQHPGSRAVTTPRACGGGASEHKDGRAIDWMVSFANRKDRKAVNAMLARWFATDEEGNEHALARRMGIMYLIWNDHIYASYDEFGKRAYLSSSCRTRKKCSVTLRHRDHVHISLSRPGAKARTSWYAAPKAG